MDIFKNCLLYILSRKSCCAGKQFLNMFLDNFKTCSSVGLGVNEVYVLPRVCTKSDVHQTSATSFVLALMEDTAHAIQSIRLPNDGHAVRPRT